MEVLRGEDDNLFKGVETLLGVRGGLDSVLIAYLDVDNDFSSFNASSNKFSSLQKKIMILLQWFGNVSIKRKIIKKLRKSANVSKQKI